MRRLRIVSTTTMLVGIAAVLGVIGYRVSKDDGSAAPAVVTAHLPKGAKIVGTGVAGDRIAVTIDVGGAIEVRTFDLKTLRPAGTLKLAPEP